MFGSHEIKLKEHQFAHRARIQKILETSSGYIDGSPTGSGKTFVTLSVAKDLGLPIYVICPSDVQGIWLNLSQQFRIPVVGITTYQSFTSRTGKQPDHGLLTRSDVKENVTFSPTVLLDKKIQSGIFFIVDEAHKIKNDSAQSRACIEMTNRINDIKSNSKFALLSGSLFDKNSHVYQILKALCLLDKTCDDADEIYLNMSIEEMFKKFPPCEIVDEYKKLKSKRKSAVNSLVFQFYNSEVKHRYSSSMEKPEYEFQQTFRNSFFDSSERNAKNLRELVEKLAEKTRAGKTKEEQKDMTSIFTYLQEIEYYKVEIFVSRAIEILETDPTAKVVICLNYIRTMDNVALLLSKYEPIIFNGSIQAAARSMFIEKFQTSPKHRLFIMSTTLSVGFNLHDQKGGEPRHMLISPGYKATDIHQAVGRINRTGMMSPSYVDIMYSADANKEFEIITALTEKSSVLSSVHEEQVNSGMVFPGDYPIYYKGKRCETILDIQNEK